MLLQYSLLHLFDPMMGKIAQDVAAYRCRGTMLLIPELFSHRPRKKMREGFYGQSDSVGIIHVVLPIVRMLTIIPKGFLFGNT